jgi:hypothetical protein
MSRPDRLIAIILGGAVARGARPAIAIEAAKNHIPESRERVQLASNGRFF